MSIGEAPVFASISKGLGNHQEGRFLLTPRQVVGFYLGDQVRDFHFLDRCGRNECRATSTGGGRTSHCEGGSSAKRGAHSGT